MNDNYFKNYSLISQYWKIFRSLELVLHELEQVQEIFEVLSYRGTKSMNKERVFFFKLERYIKKRELALVAIKV